MKFLLPLIAIIVFASCEKKRCYDCVISNNYSKNGVDTVERKNLKVCDRTEDEIREYEKLATHFDSKTGNSTITSCR